ncbi:hypothetical protein ASPVEDRAFT_83796 [Aspergillus versicolor CBS 583.65]|uniref:Zn(2)-C6 fungal-type domain-containing protein n=1 Tax=Aspergillus versicolor CBS 583.65 TaxID=1036611 RepID=A0A1L9PL81_ASPVE|nr:uncharacterized protein ASPVEDRAFT_83796 [Aspergillus versicolor CBS 583.65]OJJ02287.1 hypothetical protein ASPVEDRAFT_83796 [Aspergillus versicolor CBS 583.65]
MNQQAAPNPVLHTPGDLQSVTFLPVNEPSSPTTHRAKRGSQSCDNCRDTKKRCEQISPEGCRRCVDGGRVCRTTQQRKRRKLRWTSSRQDAKSTPNLEAQVHSTSDQGTLAIDTDGSPDAQNEEPEGRELLQRAHNTKEKILSTDLLDARDALDLIAVAGSRERMGERLQLNDRQSLTQRGPRIAIPPSKTDLDGFFLIRKGIARPCEVHEYLGFYFTHLWQAFPVIPQWYATPERYGLLVRHEPVLAISLVALASRYHSLSGLNGVARSERVHWRTWLWVQRLFQSAMWGSAGMRSYGAIAALLLSIEWHPRAINSQEDFVGDYGEPELFEPSGLEDTTAIHRPPEGHSTPKRLNLVATAHRSNRMSWILLSTSISLAEEMGCFEDPSGRVPAERRTPDSVHLDWPHILRTFLRITDESLSLRLRLESQLRGLRSVEIADCLPSALAADGFWESTSDLATQMGKARDLLRSWRKSQHAAGPSIPLAAWDSFRRSLDRWKRQRQLNSRDISLRDACLDIEYYYVRICGLSPAAHMFESATVSHDSPAMHSLSRFADDATEASIDLLDSVIHNVAPSSFFKYAPVKTWLYIVCAALYLLKVTLKIEKRLDGSDPHIFRILSAVDAIKQNAPDDIHMAQRYATLLDILVSAATRSSSNATHDVTQDEAHRTSGIANADYLANPYDSQFLDTATGDSIYDPHFWDSLPDMIGLNNVSDLFMPVFE